MTRTAGVTTESRDETEVSAREPAPPSAGQRPVQSTAIPDTTKDTGPEDALSAANSAKEVPTEVSPEVDQLKIERVLRITSDGSNEASSDGVAASGTNKSTDTTASPAPPSEIRYIQYDKRLEASHLPAIRRMISMDLSEPYSIYVYRYFLYSWPHLCFMAVTSDIRPNKTSSNNIEYNDMTQANDDELNDSASKVVGVVVCKLEQHRSGPLRGYIAMLATQKDLRGRGIATNLVTLAIDRMNEDNAQEIVLETEVDNAPSLKLYRNLGFLRTKRLHRYYLSGSTAFRLVLYLQDGVANIPTCPPEGPYHDQSGHDRNDEQDWADYGAQDPLSGGVPAGVV
ncbi:N-alpha-acetyltransferase 30 [Elasticomyces elasticus]|nr:N-alpha-acetyltransferase 30 [Elasticomyces elasticus]